jgi:hypothetical protein
MKITVMGFLTLVSAIVLLTVIAYQVGTEIDKRGRKSNEQPNSPS